jgi:hypothetical protein
MAWCRPGAVAGLGPTTGLRRADLYGRPVATTTLGSWPVLFHSHARASPAKVLRQVLAAIQL